MSELDRTELDILRFVADDGVIDVFAVPIAGGFSVTTCWWDRVNRSLSSDDVEGLVREGYLSVKGRDPSGLGLQLGITEKGNKALGEKT